MLMFYFWGRVDFGYQKQELYLTTRMILKRKHCK